jgi:hypothetical protein
MLKDIVGLFIFIILPVVSFIIYLLQTIPSNKPQRRQKEKETIEINTVNDFRNQFPILYDEVLQEAMYQERIRISEVLDIKKKIKGHDKFIEKQAFTTERSKEQVAYLILEKGEEKNVTRNEGTN